MVNRRKFLSLVGAAALAPRMLGAATRSGSVIVHPDPRPDIDASLVLSPEKLAKSSEKVVALFEGIRAIPQIADGIGCNCGCSALPTYRSLLTCYYETGMARGCMICQGEARLVIARHAEGQSLEQIRRAIDARFG
jgi:hypothetical protein